MIESNFWDNVLFWWSPFLASIWKMIAGRMPVGLVAWVLIRAWENASSKPVVDSYFGEGDREFNPEFDNPTICEIYELWEINNTK